MLQLLFVAATAAAALLLSGNSGCKQPTQSDTTRTPRDTTPPPPVTPDTTSSNFSWQLDTLGTQGELYDVAIINDTDAWAVGEIHTPQTDRYDSNGHWVAMYNAAHWDGRKWELVRIWGDSATNLIGPFTVVYAFGHNDVWAGGSMLWNGKSWRNMYSFNGAFTGRVTRMWGTSDNDLFSAQDNGQIVHWNGRSFSAMATGTTLPIVDIYGDMNPKTGQEEILAVASSEADKPGETHLLRINGAAVAPVYDSGMTDHHISALWFKPEEKYVIAGEGVFVKHSLQDTTPWSYFPPGVVTSYYSDGVCGEDTNDIFVAGDFGEIIHYNGKSWHKYPKVIALSSIAGYAAVQMKGNSVFACGYLNGIVPFVLRGKR